jgi:hypothetical protein
MDNEQSNIFSQTDEVLLLEGLFFIRSGAIKENDELIQKTFQDLYKYVSYN